MSLAGKEAVAAPLLRADGIQKRYPGVVALAGVDFEARGGEVHALVGANGAGKSTMLSIFAGVQRPDRGTIAIAGRPVQFDAPADALREGIATVYQEFSLVPQLSVARNLWLGREPRGMFGLVDGRALITDTRSLLDRLGLDLDPEAEVSTLSVAEQQLVEIARALSFDARILILDEPTAVLSASEQDNLFELVRRIKAEGVLVVYVSHHLGEVLEIADRVTVMRDGLRIATHDASTLAIDDLVELMVGGRSGDDGLKRKETARDGKSFEIRYSTDRGVSHLAIGAGEIVGLAGLVGAGRTTFARALAGFGGRGAAASLREEKGWAPVSGSGAAMRNGIVYLTEDRKRDGLFANLDIVANTSATALGRFAKGPFRRRHDERKAAQSMLERLRLVAGSLEMPISQLSGGNQQKVLIARALLAEPRLLVCDEPTRGVDIGAKEEIHRILVSLAESGMAILVISAEMDELLAISDRIAVMRDRLIVAVTKSRDTEETTLLALASGMEQTDTTEAI